jgi:hypothetical protein
MMNYEKIRTLKTDLTTCLMTCSEESEDNHEKLRVAGMSQKFKLDTFQM